MVDLNTDISAGSILLSSKVFTTEKLSRELTSRIHQNISVDANGNPAAVADNRLSLAFVDASIPQNMLSVGNMIYVCQSNTIDALNERIVNCANGTQDMDAVSKKQIDDLYNSLVMGVYDESDTSCDFGSDFGLVDMQTNQYLSIGIKTNSSTGSPEFVIS